MNAGVYFLNRDVILQYKQQPLNKRNDMKTFQLTHVLRDFDVYTITLTETEISMDPTVPREDYEKAMKLEVGESMIIHYGGPVVQGSNLMASNLIRKEDNNKGE